MLRLSNTKIHNFEQLNGITGKNPLLLAKKWYWNVFSIWLIITDTVPKSLLEKPARVSEVGIDYQDGSFTENESYDLEATDSGEYPSSSAIEPETEEGTGNGIPNIYDDSGEDVDDFYVEDITNSATEYGTTEYILEYDYGVTENELDYGNVNSEYELWL